MKADKKEFVIRPLETPFVKEGGRRYTHFIVPEEGWLEHQSILGAIRRLLEEFCGRHNVITTFENGARNLLLSEESVKDNQLIVRKVGSPNRRLISERETVSLRQEINELIEIAAKNPELNAQQVFDLLLPIEIKGVDMQQLRKEAAEIGRNPKTK